MDPNNDWLHELLVSVQLEQFYSAIRDQLQISRLAHFDYVHADDLEKIGLSKPGIRRLFDAVRKTKFQHWNRKFWRKLFGSSSASSAKYNIITPRSSSEPRTCVILEKDINLLSELGTGSFGVVKKGEWKVPDEPNKVLQVAVKVLKADAFSQPGVYEDFHREVESMHSLKHPNLIKLYGIVVHPLMMVCELATMGALLDYLRGKNGQISLHSISKWSEQVAAGMAYLECNRFLHRDLACRNILLANLEMVKIGDFGLMRALPDADDCYVMSERRRVPFPWCAPESLRSRQFSHASDVWMFAVSLWEMYTFGEDPWMGLNGSEILRLIMREGQRLSAPNACPPDVYMLMTKCWDLDPRERPSFAGILKYMQMYKFQTGFATQNYMKDGQLKAMSGDEIVLIDRREELYMWKVQNQRTLQIDMYPVALIKIQIQEPIIPKDKKKVHNTFSGFNKTDKARPTIPQLKSSPRSLEELDLPVHLRKSSTIESTQATSTRAGNPTGNKHFNYNKLVNDRTRVLKERSKRDAQSKSFGGVKEDLLIDLDLPPSTRSSLQPKRSETRSNVSLLDQPIDVPQVLQNADWGSQADSLPTISASNTQNLFATKSLDNLALIAHTSARMSTPQPITNFDPFELPNEWPIESNYQPMTQRPNYEIPTNTRINNESHNTDNNIPTNSIYSNSPRYASSQFTNNLTLNNTNFQTTASHSNGIRNPDINVYSGQYANMSGDTMINNVALSKYPESKVNQIQSNVYSNNIQSQDTTYENIRGTLNESSALLYFHCSEQKISKPLSELSLDDKISASLNLSTNRLNESMYANIYGQTSSSSMTNTTETPRNISQDVSAPIYSNYALPTNQQQFLLETKDFYTKTSTTNNASNNYEKNIYIPKDSSEKLSNFSESVENSKNYSAMKYDSYDYWSDGTFSTCSRSDRPPYDLINDTGSNVYSEIDDAAYTNTRLYDEVYEPRPRPHRPAPPCPTNK